MHSLFPDKAAVLNYVEWYKQKCRELLAEKSFSYDGVPGKNVDIIRDVVNLVSVHWAADKLVCLPVLIRFFLLNGFIDCGGLF